MKSFRHKSLMYIESRFPNRSRVALERGVSLLYKMVSNITIGDVALTAKIHVGNVAVVECTTTARVFSVQDSSDQAPSVLDGVTIEEMVSWFYETAENKDYGHVELVCTVRDGRVVRVNRIDGNQHLVTPDGGAADAA